VSVVCCFTVLVCNINNGRSNSYTVTLSAYTAIGVGMSTDLGRSQHRLQVCLLIREQVREGRQKTISYYRGSATADRTHNFSAAAGRLLATATAPLLLRICTPVLPLPSAAAMQYSSLEHIVSKSREDCSSCSWLLQSKLRAATAATWRAQ
jgi:hypothetical protein